jgi:hypothetical protein
MPSTLPLRRPFKNGPESPDLDSAAEPHTMVTRWPDSSSRFEISYERVPLDPSGVEKCW